MLDVVERKYEKILEVRQSPNDCLQRRQDVSRPAGLALSQSGLHTINAPSP